MVRQKAPRQKRRFWVWSVSDVSSRIRAARYADEPDGNAARVRAALPF